MTADSNGNPIEPLGCTHEFIAMDDPDGREFGITADEPSGGDAQ
jgi:hypothetical protein